MAFKLTKKQLEERSRLVDLLREKTDAIESELEAFNAALVDMSSKIEGAIEAYNAALSEAREFVEDIANATEEAIENKSEKWRDSDKGAAAQTYLDSWRDISLDDLEIELPEELEIEEPQHASELEELPEELEE